MYLKWSSFTHHNGSVLCSETQRHQALGLGQLRHFVHHNVCEMMFRHADAK